MNNRFKSVYPRDIANIIFLYVKNELKLKSFFIYKNTDFFFGDEIIDSDTRCCIIIRLKPYHTIETHYYDLYDNEEYVNIKSFVNLNELIDYFGHTKYKIQDEYYDIKKDQVLDKMLDKIYKI